MEIKTKYHQNIHVGSPEEFKRSAQLIDYALMSDKALQEEYGRFVSRLQQVAQANGREVESELVLNLTIK